MVRQYIYCIILLLCISKPSSAQRLMLDERFVVFVADPKKMQISMHWRDEHGERFGSISRLQAWFAQHHLAMVFVANGGMFRDDHSPVGLYIQNKKTIRAAERNKGEGNFYLKPNGIFYLTDENQAGICKTENFIAEKHIRFATQSGPMLLIDGQIHSAFKKASLNLNIRNGVGILPDQTVVFVMSKKGINFYDFARYFKQLGCRNALYLDGAISQTWCPSAKHLQTGGDFGVMIAVSEKKK